MSVLGVITTRVCLHCIREYSECLRGLMAATLTCDDIMHDIVCMLSLYVMHTPDCIKLYVRSFQCCCVIVSQRENNGQ